MSMIECNYINIAGIQLAIQTKYPIQISKRFQPFLSKKVESGYKVVLEETEELSKLPEQLVHKSRSYEVFQECEGAYVRRFFEGSKNEETFSIAKYDWDKHTITVEYLSKGRENLSSMSVCFFQIAWETLLIHENRMILHAACIDTPYGGILFSGPSGIGKSTQAELWCQYGEAKLLNGDRPILHKENDEWYAYGSPYAGSSKCHINERCGVRAIVMLQQADKCQLRRLGLTEAFQKVFQGLTINSWDKFFVDTACDLTIQLVKDIPVYELSCTPSQEAVKILQQELAKGGTTVNEK